MKFVKVMDELGEALAYIAFYKGKPIASGTAKQVWETFKNAFNKTGKALDDELAILLNSQSRFAKFNSVADPVYELLGAAVKSHPKRVREITDYLASRKAEIIYRDSEILAYSPGLSKGQPGQMHIHPDASISAYEHEFRHFLDDEVNGFLGMESLFDFSYRVQTELNAYRTEINIVKKIKGDNLVIIDKLKNNFLSELKLIQSNLGVNTIEPPLKKIIDNFLKM